MKHKLVPVAAAIFAALTSYNVAAESATDVLTDGWEVHGYGSMNYRFNEDFQSFDSELGKPDYRTADTYSQHIRPKLTTVNFPVREMGIEAAKGLLHF